LESLGKKLIARRYPGEYPIVLCNCPLDGDLFSSYDGDVAVITTHGWTRKFSPYSLQRYLAYVVADVLMSFHVDTTVHYETKGCLGDYCDNKREINLGLGNCSYCSDCQAMILKDVAKGSISVTQLAAIYKILDLAAERKTCFVLMPFAKEFDAVYAKSIYPTVKKQGWTCRRADKIFQPREIVTIILEQILRADLIIADLTGRNPDVFYELGYAHAVHKNTILITQSIEDVPFDLRHRQMVEYSAHTTGYKVLNRALKAYTPRN
jgi:hypothetical protein